MGAFADDLRFAQTAGVCVELHLMDGRRLLTSVREVNEEEGFVTIHDPQHYGDEVTTTKVDLLSITSVTVTEIDC